MTPLGKIAVPPDWRSARLVRKLVPTGDLADDLVVIDQDGEPPRAPELPAFGMELVRARRDVEIAWPRSWRERLLSRPWRPLHHEEVWHFEAVCELDVRQAEDGGLRIVTEPGARPRISFRIDPGRLLLEIGLAAIAPLALLYLLEVAPW